MTAPETHADGVAAAVRRYRTLCAESGVEPKDTVAEAVGEWARGGHRVFSYVGRLPRHFNHRITAQDAPSLCALLAPHIASLEALDLSNNQLTAAAMDILAPLLTAAQGLQRLNLQHNWIEDGCTPLLTALSSAADQRALLYLNLEGCRLRKDCSLPDRRHPAITVRRSG